MRVRLVAFVFMSGTLLTASLYGQQSVAEVKNQMIAPASVESTSLAGVPVYGKAILAQEGQYNAAFNAYQSAPQYFAFSAANADEVVVYRDPSNKKIIAKVFKELSDPEKALVNEHKTEIERSMFAIRSNKASESDLAEARRIVTEELDIQFEIDLDARKAQLKEVEKQLADLKEQLSRRQDAKAKLIALRMQLLENESNGLGFPSTWNSSSKGTSVRHYSNTPIGSSPAKIVPATAKP